MAEGFSGSAISSIVGEPSSAIDESEMTARTAVPHMWTAPPGSDDSFATQKMPAEDAAAQPEVVLGDSLHSASNFGDDTLAADQAGETVSGGGDNNGNGNGHGAEAAAAEANGSAVAVESLGTVVTMEPTVAVEEEEAVAEPLVGEPTSPEQLTAVGATGVAEPSGEATTQQSSPTALKRARAACKQW